MRRFGLPQGLRHPFGRIVIGGLSIVVLQVIGPAVLLLVVLIWQLTPGASLKSHIVSGAIGVGIGVFQGIALQVLARRRAYQMESFMIMEQKEILRLEDDGKRVVYQQRFKIRARQHGLREYCIRTKWSGKGQLVECKTYHADNSYTVAYDDSNSTYTYEFLPLRKGEDKDIGLILVFNEPNRTYNSHMSFAAIPLFSALCHVTLELQWDDDLAFDANRTHVSVYRNVADDGFRNKPPLEVLRNLKRDVERSVSWTVRNPRPYRKYKLVFSPPWDPPNRTCRPAAGQGTGGRHRSRWRVFGPCKSY